MSRDHIIPKFILKGFAINPEVAPKNQAVLIYDVKRKETKRIKIADAYQLENFNSDITENIWHINMKTMWQNYFRE